VQSILGHLDRNLIQFVKIFVGRSCFAVSLLVIKLDLPSVDRIYL
jgi:hypothetical protein